MKITDHTADVIREVNNKVSTSLETVKTLLVNSAKSLASVKTGTLRDSIEGKVEGSKLTVGSPLDYAPKVEMNKPFLRPSLLQKKAAIKELLRNDKKVLGQ